MGKFIHASYILPFIIIAPLLLVFRVMNEMFGSVWVKQQAASLILNKTSFHITCA